MFEPLSIEEFNEKLIHLAKNDRKALKEAWKKHTTGEDITRPSSFAQSILEIILTSYTNLFYFTKEIEQLAREIITKEDIVRIKEQLNGKGGKKPTFKKIEKASYQWQMFLLQVIQLIKPYLCEDFKKTGGCDNDWRVDYATFDAARIVLYNKYPKFLDDVEYIAYKKLKNPLF
jgi:SpoVK/Ycf46/Vps4 family AAA+-type ATPase